MNSVAGKFQIDRPLVPDGRVEAAVDLAKGGQRIVQRRAGDGDLLEDLALRAEVAAPCDAAAGC